MLKIIFTLLISVLLTSVSIKEFTSEVLVFQNAAKVLETCGIITLVFLSSTEKLKW
jgi:hypothetical protein